MAESSWGEYEKRVMAELERHAGQLDKLDERFNNLRIELAMLQIKAGLWGSLSGVIVAVIGWLILRMK